MQKEIEALEESTDAKCAQILQSLRVRRRAEFGART
jgi:hypothetical protein